ncbi:hypothetical protein ABBQ32_003648 [Trebouxia sp. C0010 RCD-2024]
MHKGYDAKHRAESFEVGEFADLSPKGVNTPPQPGNATSSKKQPGRPAKANPSGVSTPPQSGTAPSREKKLGRPAKANKQPGMAKSGVQKRRSDRLRKKH